MLATLGGALALAVGVAVLLLPVLVSELSRPRDASWGGVVLLLGLVLVTSAERLTGSPMLAVLCGGLLIGRLGTEVGLSRWRQLTEEERQRLGSRERWRSSVDQLAASLAGVGQRAGGVLASLAGTLGSLGGAVTAGRKPKAGGKRWVRPEAPPAETPTAETVAAIRESSEEAGEESTVAVVRDFGEIEARLEAAEPPAPVQEAAETLLEEVPVEVVEPDEPLDAAAPDGEASAPEGEPTAPAEAG
jgi:hypothetical protein